ncbi:uncharacterized protein [Palaemon carinicauda]|uniref:uncharacterized protein n=1 Tax=Palaemon carinicauda TaxID=392227 RepID=UPI0035B60758
MILHSAGPTISLLDEKVLVRDLSNTNSLPLAELNLNCEFVSSKVKIAVINTPFPVHDVQVLLGNDLAGQLALPNLILYNQPLDNNSNDLDIFEHFIEESNFISDLGEHDIEEVETEVDTDRCDPIENFVGVVTRAKAKQAVNEGVPDIVKTNIPCTNSELINLQRADATLTNALKQASTKEGKVPGYYFDKGVLFRLYRPRKLSSNDTWANKEQLVVPLTLRKNILSVAHQADSHLGVSKTYKRIANDFFWPGMKHDVFEFVKECHVCQVVGKPNEVIPKAPLVPIVIPHEPFSKVIIDCVGPLPKTKKGNQYILTILCPTTRYPIAIPLGNICARNIVKHLLKVFTTYGYPKEIQSDRGTNFTSDLFNETLREFNVKHILASPYHPQSQGALERHHQTLKSLLRKFCMETGTDWDESLDLILFVIREVPNDSLGMSPFEMLFGHEVRGPLQVLKDKMLNNDTLDNVTVGQYVDKLKCNFEKVHNFAFNNLKSSQDVMKENFDLKAKVRKFKEGDSVLVYFPTPSSPLQHKFSGPYIIQKCVNNNNYIISTPDRRKSTQLVHVNLIKKYHGNPPVALHCLSDSNELDFKKYNASAHQSKTPMPHDVDLNHSNDFVSWTDSANQEILQNILVYLQHLPRKQRSQLAELFRKYRSICGDVPQRCSDAEHDIELQPGTRPIRQHYYRTSLEKQQRMKEEVSYLLKNGLATRSTSAWASPCLLVPKPNGKVRLCTDFRQINNVTIKDSYPLPRIDDILDAIGAAKYLSQIDLLRGYYQIPLTDRAKLISAFITPFGLFQYERLPFGLTNAPATFQCLVNSVIKDLDGTYVYIDDIVVTSDTLDEHIHRLKALFGSLQEFGLTIHLAKSSFGKGKVKYLGHIIGSGEIVPKDENITAIVEFPVPRNRKSLLRFLGMTSYYRKFCKKYSIVATPLIDLTSPKNKMYGLLTVNKLLIN